MFTDTLSFTVCVIRYGINRKKKSSPWICIISIISIVSICAVRSNHRPRLQPPVDVPRLIIWHRSRLSGWNAHETPFFLPQSFWFPVEHILANQIQRFPNRLDRALQAGSVYMCACMRTYVCAFKEERRNKGGGGRVEKVKKKKKN